MLSYRAFISAEYTIRGMPKVLIYEVLNGKFWTEQYHTIAYYNVAQSPTFRIIRSKETWFHLDNCQKECVSQHIIEVAEVSYLLLFGIIHFVLFISASMVIIMSCLKNNEELLIIPTIETLKT